MVRKNARAGFTLIEILVVVLIIGVLAALALPQFFKSMEVAKADDALGYVQSVAAANRQFYIDHQSWVSGPLTTCSPDGSSSDSCNGQSTGACDLMYCGYLARQSLQGKAYDFYAGTCGSSAGAAANATMSACARRDAGTATVSSPYDSWGYTVSINGSLVPNSSNASQLPPTQ